MKPAELRKKSKDELKKLLLERKKRIRSLHFDTALDKVKNVKEVKEGKKDIARILTILKKEDIKS